MDSDFSPIACRRGFRIADLAGSADARVFRFVSRETIAVTAGSHAELGEAARRFVDGAAGAFIECGVSFKGEPPDDEALRSFARELSSSEDHKSGRPLVGRYWNDFEVPAVGIFGGVSFWLTHTELREVDWAKIAACEILAPKDPVYVESIDQILPELAVQKTHGRKLSRIDPTISSDQIDDLFNLAVHSPDGLSRKEWEIVAELKHLAYETVEPGEAPWRWNREFYARIADHRMRLAFHDRSC